MSVAAFTGFRGGRPVVSPKLLPENFAQPAINTDLLTGNLRPYFAPLLEDTFGKQAADIKTLYKLVENVWLHWYEEVNVARMPIAENTLNRVAYTGAGGQPLVTDEQLAISGGGDNYPEVSYALGVPAPDKILEVERFLKPPDGVQLNWDISGTAGDEIGNRIARVYTYTFVNNFGEEGPPADPSQISFTNDDECTLLTNFAGTPTGPYLIEKVRIYRSLTTALGQATFLLVDEVPFPVIEPYQDCKPDTELGEALVSETWFEPPAELKGITAMANGILAGFIGNTLYFSEPYQGHAWPEDYQRAVDHPIVGLAAAGNMLYVMTEGYPYTAVGNHPDVISLNKLERAQACISSRSIVDMGAGAIYASSSGLVFLTASGARLITMGVFDRRAWSQIAPTNLHGYFYKDKYFGFYDATGVTPPPPDVPLEGGFIFDPEQKDVVFVDTTADSAFFDPVDGFLHIAEKLTTENQRFAWDGDRGNKLVQRWRSRETETRRTNFTAARVSALAYPVTFRLLVDDVVKLDYAVQNKRPFRLPSEFTSRDWVVEVEGTEEIEAIFFADTMEELW